MINKYCVFLLLYTSFCSWELYAEPNRLNDVSIDYYDLVIKLRYDTDKFFTGSLTVQKNGEIVFSADSIYSEYIEHSQADLDGDGSKELIISVSTGASPYIYNELLIFDKTQSNGPMFSVQNADVVQKEKQKPKLSVYIRMSPSVLGIGYNWYLEYKNKKLTFFRAADMPWLGDVVPDEKETIDAIKLFSEDGKQCENTDNYLSYFEAYALQSKIAGDELKGLEFFEQYYKCKGKSEAIKNLKKNVSDSYKWINDTKNYNYTNER